MLPDEMEAEKNRKMILAQADEIDILKRNVRDLQGQLNSAQIHNKNLTQSLANAYADISRLAETMTNARKRIKELIGINADAMVIIGDKHQKINAMEGS